MTTNKKPAKKKVCEWKLEEDYGFYMTGCDKAFDTTMDDIKATGIKFCPFCGGKIKEKK